MNSKIEIFNWSDTSSRLPAQHGKIGKNRKRKRATEETKRMVTQQQQRKHQQHRYLQEQKHSHSQHAQQQQPDDDDTDDDAAIAAEKKCSAITAAAVEPNLKSSSSLNQAAKRSLVDITCSIIKKNVLLSTKLKSKPNKIYRQGKQINRCSTTCRSKPTAFSNKRRFVQSGGVPGTSSNTTSAQTSPSKFSVSSDPDVPRTCSASSVNVDEGRKAFKISPIKNFKYEKLMLSLQSPLPNEYEFALNSCLILSVIGDGKGEQRLNVLEQTPGLLTALLAHAGFFRDCQLRRLVEETYVTAFGKDVDFASFWERLLSVSEDGDDDNQQIQQRTFNRCQLLCECFPGKLAELSEAEKGLMYGLCLRNGVIEDDADVANTVKCCERCRVRLPPSPLPEDNVAAVDLLDVERGWTLSMVQTLQTHNRAVEKIERRIQMVGKILRNFSLENGNARVMATNSTLLRFLIVTAQSGYSVFTQFAFDIIGNICKFVTISTSSLKTRIQEDQLVLLQLKSIMSNFVKGTFLLTNDRFKVLCCLEAIAGLAISDGQMDKFITDQRLFERLFQLLTLTRDYILVINCLECAFAATTMGEVTCNEIVSVRGSLATLVAFVTKGIIIDIPLYDAVVNSIRITAVLTLRNIVRHSSKARRELKLYELRLAEIAMGGDDKDVSFSWILAEILYYLGNVENNPAIGNQQCRP